MTFVFTASSVVAQQLLGFFIAQVVVRSEDRGLFGSTIVRTTALVAWVVPGIAGGIIWKMLFNEAPFGGLNSLLRMVGAAPVQWLSDPEYGHVVRRHFQRLARHSLFDGGHVCRH